MGARGSGYGDVKRASEEFLAGRGMPRKTAQERMAECFARAQARKEQGLPVRRGKLNEAERLAEAAARELGD